MRFMVLVPGSPQSEAGEMPSQELLEAMTKFNEELVKAGVMLAGDGPSPDVEGREGALRGSERTVIDGPFAETKEIVAGYWIWQVQVDGGGGRVAQARAVRRRRRGRAASDLRDRRLRRGADAGAARGRTSGCASRPRRRS